MLDLLLADVSPKTVVYLAYFFGLVVVWCCARLHGCQRLTAAKAAFVSATALAYPVMMSPLASQMMTIAKPACDAIAWCEQDIRRQREASRQQRSLDPQHKN